MVKSKAVLSQNNGCCIYTQRPATSADHVPPKSFLASPLPENLLTVPACRDFNSAAALDEQYFMTVLAQIGHHPALAWRIIDGGDIDRALVRRPALEERLIAEMSVDENGRPYISPDQKRIDSVLRKLAAGLFFVRFDTAPGLEAFSPIALYELNNPPEHVVDLSWEFEHKEPIRVIQWSVFSFGFCNISENYEATYCNINFYNSIFAIVSCPYQTFNRKCSVFEDGPPINLAPMCHAHHDNHDQPAPISRMIARQRAAQHPRIVQRRDPLFQCRQHERRYNPAQ